MQRLKDEEDNQRKLAKNYRYKAELEAQLNEKSKMANFERQVKNNPLEQKTLEENYMRFEQKEFDRINNGRMRTKNVMQENRYNIMHKMHEKTALEQQDKDVFNRQALEDKLHAERNAQEKQRFKDWQREALKHDYDEQIKRKEQMNQMEKVKERDYADQYKQSVEKFENDNHRMLETLRQRNDRILETQKHTIIPDVNDRRKLDTVNNMKRQFESTEKEAMKNELQRLSKRNYDANETKNMLKHQMDARRKQIQDDINNDIYYKSYVDNTLNILSERDKKIKEDQERIKRDYAKDLENQIKEHQSKVKTMYNEMDERELTLNQRNLINYEIGQNNKDMFRLPGLARDPNDNREYFGRYSKDKIPNKKNADFGLGLKIGETMSHSSNKPLSSKGGNVLGSSYNRYQHVPKTSMEDGMGRRNKSIKSPKYNIINNKGLTDAEYEPKKSLLKYRSMADLPTKNYQSSTNVLPSEMPPVETKPTNTTLLSPRRGNDAPEYEPTRRDSVKRRSMLDGGVSKSVANFDSVKDKAKVSFEPQEQQPLPQTTQTNQKFEKLKKAPGSLLDINKQLNSRIMGNLRTGNLTTSVDNISYGRDVTQNLPTYKGPIG